MAKDYNPAISKRQLERKYTGVLLITNSQSWRGRFYFICGCTPIPGSQYFTKQLGSKPLLFAEACPDDPFSNFAYLLSSTGSISTFNARRPLYLTLGRLADICFDLNQCKIYLFFISGPSVVDVVKHSWPLTLPPNKLELMKPWNKSV